MAETPIIMCDAVQAVGVHNGIARIAFIRLDAAGKASPALELLMPVSQVATLTKALQAVGRTG